MSAGHLGAAVPVPIVPVVEPLIVPVVPVEPPGVIVPVPIEAPVDIDPSVLVPGIDVDIEPLVLVPVDMFVERLPDLLRMVLPRVDFIPVVD